MKIIFKDVDLSKKILNLKEEYKKVKNIEDDKNLKLQVKFKNGGVVVQLDKKVHYFKITDEDSEFIDHLVIDFDVDKGKENFVRC